MRVRVLVRLRVRVVGLGLVVVLLLGLVLLDIMRGLHGRVVIIRHYRFSNVKMVQAQAKILCDFLRGGLMRMERMPMAGPVL